MLIVDGLQGSTTYTATVGISSYAGTATATAAFTTLKAPSRIAPPFTFSILASRRTIGIGDSVTISGHRGNVVPLDSEGDPPLVFLQASDTRHGPWRASPGEDETYANEKGRVEWTDQNPDRNTWFRIYVPKSAFPIRAPSISPLRLVYVTPDVTFNVERPHSSVEVDADYTARVHALAHYHGQLVYFYRRYDQTSPLSRFGAVRLRYTASGGEPELVADLSYNDTRGGQVIACTQHELLPDMGRPYRDAACGRTTITAPS